MHCLSHCNKRNKFNQEWTDSLYDGGSTCSGYMLALEAMKQKLVYNDLLHHLKPNNVINNITNDTLAKPNVYN